MTNFIQKTHLDIGFSDFNCLLDSQCSLLTSQILGSCIKLKWSNRAYAVYWLCGTLLCPCCDGSGGCVGCVGVNCGWDGGDGSGGWVGGVSNGTRAKICKNTGRAPTRVICATRALLGL